MRAALFVCANPLVATAMVYYIANTQEVVRSALVMKFERLVKALAPVAVMGMALAATGCDAVNIKMGEADGVPLDELDMSGPVPEKLVLSLGDKVILTEGDTLSIEIEGDAKAREDLRFQRENGTLAIGRASGFFKNSTPATIRVTMAAPKEMVIGGSGEIAAQRLASKAQLVIGGSGTISFAPTEMERLEITIGGSGTVKGAGSAERMEITIGGNGEVDLAGLKAERAEVSIGGSGDVAFASDGTVEASMSGSGTVTVTGDAKCTSKSMGSGQLICKAATPAPAS
jgi:hypothetical protein